MSRYREEGRKAYLDGQSLEDNPYLYPFFKRQYNEWKNGYIDVKEEVRPIEVHSIPNTGESIKPG